MSDNALARMDSGEANKRILSKLENRADFRRVEAASLKRTTRLQSHDAKTAFVRCFMSLQESMYVISEIGRTKLPEDAVEQIEEAVLKKMQEIDTELNQAFDGAELLLKNNGIETVATYETKPLEIEVGITSAMGRRYFEMIHKLDQLMPILATLSIEEVVKQREIAHKKSRVKRIVLAMASMTRNLKVGVRRRMNEADAKARAAEEAKGKPVVALAASSDSVSAESGLEQSADAANVENPAGTAVSEPVLERTPPRSRQESDPGPGDSVGTPEPASTEEPANVPA